MSDLNVLTGVLVGGHELDDASDQLHAVALLTDANLRIRMSHIYHSKHITSCYILEKTGFFSTLLCYKRATCLGRSSGWWT